MAPGSERVPSISNITPVTGPREKNGIIGYDRIDPLLVSTQNRCITSIMELVGCESW